MRRDVEFDAAGTTLRGCLYLPDDTQSPQPAVVVTHGYGAVKEQYTDVISERLCAANLAVLLYDHPCFGSSDGEPRQEVDPQRQIDGYRHAITYLSTLPEIDQDRIGIAGTSYSGGHVIVVAAKDRRVKCVYSQVPAISGGTTFSRFIRSDAVVGLREMFNNDRTARFKGEPPAMLPLITEDPNGIAALVDRETYEWYQTIEPERLKTWRNEVTLRSVEMAMEYEPGDYISRISPTPLMLVIASHDILAHSDQAFAAYERALQPKQLVTLHGGHFVVYGEQFEKALSAMTTFFVDELVNSGG